MTDPEITAVDEQIETLRSVAAKLDEDRSERRRSDRLARIAIIVGLILAAVDVATVVTVLIVWSVLGQIQDVTKRQDAARVSGQCSNEGLKRYPEALNNGPDLARLQDYVTECNRLNGITPPVIRLPK